jgi:hypothetical protein
MIAASDMDTLNSIPAENIETSPESCIDALPHITLCTPALTA